MAANDCLVIEDSLPGVEAAKAAGLTVVALEEPHSAADEELIRTKADGFYAGLPHSPLTFVRRLPNKNSGQKKNASRSNRRCVSQELFCLMHAPG